MDSEVSLRTQIVRRNNTSKVLRNDGEVTQGSILVLVLFILYINDHSENENLRTLCYLYADHSMITLPQLHSHISNNL